MAIVIAQLSDSIDKGLEYDRLPPAVSVYDTAIEKMAKALDDPGFVEICIH